MPVAKGNTPWNAGTGAGWTDQRGYRWIYVTENGKRSSRREHRILMENHLGRKLEPWELVHHKDGNKSNNAIENLEVKEFGEHTAEHSRGRRHQQDTRRRIEAFALMREELRRCREGRADLLAALKGLHDNGCYATCKHYGLGDKHSAACDDVRAAISKAEGA